MNTFQTKLNFKQSGMYTYTTFLGFYASSNTPLWLNSEENNWRNKHQYMLKFLFFSSWSITLVLLTLAIILVQKQFFYLTARPLLNWRALNTSIRAINTTFSLFGFKIIFAMRTFPKILTIIDRHLFNSFLMTSWTCDCRLELKVSHILNPEPRSLETFS